MLYPLKFHPQYKYRLWGGDKLSSFLNKKDVPDKTGESWELSGIQGSLSVVSNGFLEGNTIEEICEIYMGDILGDLIYHKYGAEFPLLIKLIDANDILSIQVHPDDELAETRHNAYGKTEMWYVIQADQGSKLYTGFNKTLSKEEFLKHIENNSLATVLNEEIVKEGDCFFIPAGRVHATGAGILFAEIQQTSDITYRIFDWNRLDVDGKPRDLHIDLSVDAIDYQKQNNYRTLYNRNKNESNELANCQYFTTNFIDLHNIVDKDFAKLDSFIIYMCLEGTCKIEYDDNKIEELRKGETVLIPASLKTFSLIPEKRQNYLKYTSMIKTSKQSVMKINTSTFIMSNTKLDQCPKPDKPEYAFIGRSNVGKSSLINMLTGRKTLAKISGKPGKTQVINHFLINEEWFLVDLPGYGYAKVAKTQRSQWITFVVDYIKGRENLMCLFVLIDTRIPPQKIDLEFLDFLGSEGIPFTILFTKTDKVTANQIQKNIATFKKELLKTWESMPDFYVTSAKTAKGKEEILNFINETNNSFQKL